MPGSGPATTRVISRSVGFSVSSAADVVSSFAVLPGTSGVPRCGSTGRCRWPGRRHRSGEFAQATRRGQRVEHGTDPGGGGRRGRRGQRSERGYRGDDRDRSRGCGVRTGQPGNGRGPSRYRSSRPGRARRARSATRRRRSPAPVPRDLAPTAAPPPACVRRPRRRRPVSLNWTRSSTLDAGTAPVGRPVVVRPTREPTPGATNRGLRRHHRDPQGRPQQVRGGPPHRPDPAGPDPVHRDPVPGGLRVHRGHASARTATRSTRSCSSRSRRSPAA